MPTGDFPCSVCGTYGCNGMHHIVSCSICHSFPCRCNTGWPWTTTGTTTFRWPPEPARLHPDDIEKIARRVAELLKAP